MKQNFMFVLGKKGSVLMHMFKFDSLVTYLFTWQHGTVRHICIFIQANLKGAVWMET